GIDLPVVLGGDPLDLGPAGGDVLGRAEAGKPAIAQPAGAAQLRRRHAAEPDLDGLLDRSGPDPGTLVPEERALVVDGVLGPDPPEQREGLVEALRPLGALDAEGLLLGGIDLAEPEGRQEAAAGEAVEAG